MEKTKTLFVLTTFEKLEKTDRFNSYNLGSKRTVGIFETINKAREILEDNIGDICETIYEYGLIEEIDFGLYPRLLSHELYKIENETIIGKDGKEYYNPDLNYVKIDLPENFFPYSLIVG